jgi:hypothetical protein
MNFWHLQNGIFARFRTFLRPMAHACQRGGGRRLIPPRTTGTFPFATFAALRDTNRLCPAPKWLFLGSKWLFLAFKRLDWLCFFHHFTRIKSGDSCDFKLGLFCEKSFFTLPAS